MKTGASGKASFFAILSVYAVLLAAIPLRANGSFSHEVFDRLLYANVKDGLVRYKGFDVPEFHEYVRSLADVKPEKWSRNARLAFWMNAYNACCISNVLANPGMTNPIKVNGFFDKATFKVAGQTLTLNQIENEVIRPRFNEPLIHFGLVCAARGCPPLMRKAFTAGNVMETLRHNTRHYLASTAGALLDRESNTFSLSEIFNWYKEDFGTHAAKLMEFAAQYASDDVAAYIRANADKLHLKLLPYDWTLNAQ